MLLAEVPSDGGGPRAPRAASQLLTHAQPAPLGGSQKPGPGCRGSTWSRGGSRAAHCWSLRGPRGRQALPLSPSPRGALLLLEASGCSGPGSPGSGGMVGSLGSCIQTQRIAKCFIRIGCLLSPPAAGRVSPYSAAGGCCVRGGVGCRSWGSWPLAGSPGNPLCCSLRAPRGSSLSAG